MSRPNSPHQFPASGCWLHFCNPMIAELVGRVGYDYAVIDMEHGAVGVDGVLPLIAAAQLGGAKALVRVPERDPRWVGRLMDLGADGVMVPMVRGAEDALELANACVYPPPGTRGTAPGIVRASTYGADLDAYMENYRRNFLLVVQIETPQSVAEVEDIASIDGVDMLFIGPFDLSAASGHLGNPDHPDMQQCFEGIRNAAARAGKPVGAIPTPEFDVTTLYRQGFDLVLGGFDTSLLREAMTANANVHRRAMEHGTSPVN